MRLETSQRATAEAIDLAEVAFGLFSASESLGDEDHSDKLSCMPGSAFAGRTTPEFAKRLDQIAGL